MRKLIALCFIAFYSFTLAMPSVLAASSFETLRGGTTVRVTLPQISTIGLGVGATIDGSCDSGVSIQGIEFVRPGAAVKLRVSSVVPPKGLGKPGELTLQAVSVRCVDGSDVPLRGGVFSASGEDKSTKSIVIGLFLCVFALFMKGGEAQIPPGTTIDAFVANDIDIAT